MRSNWDRYSEIAQIALFFAFVIYVLFQVVFVEPSSWMFTIAIGAAVGFVTFGYMYKKRPLLKAAGSSLIYFSAIVMTSFWLTSIWESRPDNSTSEYNYEEETCYDKQGAYDC